MLSTVSTLSVRRHGVRALSSLANAPSALTPAEVIQNKLDSKIRSGTGGRASVSGLTVTVFGATGFLGRYVVNRFGRIGSQVVIPYRGDSYDTRHLKVMGDAGRMLFHFYSTRDPARVQQLVESSDIVINLIGRDYTTSNFSFEDVHINAAQTIAKAAKAAGVTRLLHVSALGADVESPSRFLATKALGEQAVLAEFPDATIVRPARMYGHEDRLLHRIAYLRTFPGIIGDPVVNHGQQALRPVYVGDVALGLFKLSTSADHLGRTLEFAGPRSMTYSDLIALFGETTRRVTSETNYPVGALKLIAKGISMLPPAPQFCPEDVVRMTIDETLTDGVQGLEAVGIQPTDVRDVALTFIRRYRSAAYYDQPTEGASH